MPKTLLLVDYENKQKVDLSVLDQSVGAIIFVGNSQSIPKAARNKATAHRFARVDFHKIDGSGKNALDFHIAFEFGRGSHPGRGQVLQFGISNLTCDIPPD